MKDGWFGRIIGGLVLIGIGAVFLLNHFGYTDISIGYLFSTYWPVFLILGGLSNAIGYGRHGSNWIGSLVLIGLGLYFLGRNLGFVHLSAGDFFKMFLPVILIVIGLKMLFKANWSKKGNDTPPASPIPPPPFEEKPQDLEYPTEMESSLDELFSKLEKKEQVNKGKSEAYHQDIYGSKENFQGYNQKTSGAGIGRPEVLNKSGFIGDIHLGHDYFQLKPMNISHFIGDTIIDLTKAQIPYGETKINISAFIGDVKVFVPQDMDIGITASSSALIGDLKVLSQNRSGFMNSVEITSPYYNEAGKRIKLVVNVLIGDVKVNMVG